MKRIGRAIVLYPKRRRLPSRREGLMDLLMLLRRRDMIRSLLRLAAICVLAAGVIGPVRAVILFVFVVALFAVTAGALHAFIFFCWPDTNGKNWFSYRNRHR